MRLSGAIPVGPHREPAPDSIFARRAGISPHFSGPCLSHMNALLPTLRACARFAVVIIAVCGTLQRTRAQDRLVFNFNLGWRFAKGEITNAFLPTFDDSDWAEICLPHTYNDCDTFDDLQPGVMIGETNLWSGTTWYRKHFYLPDSWGGKKLYIEFEGVRQIGDVYVNGTYLGSAKDGFLPFGFDLTPHARFGATNILAVRCENTFMTYGTVAEAENSSTNARKPRNLADYGQMVNASIPECVSALRADQIPWNNPLWHPPMGGIYRNVRIHVTDTVHIGLPLYNFLRTEGPYAFATNISARAAHVGVEIPVYNYRDTNATVEVGYKILDAFGNQAVQDNQLIHISAHTCTTVKSSVTIRDPKFWDPEDPHAYRVICEVREKGAVLDKHEIPLGIRVVRWDANTGFWMNGRPLKLRGWGQRPTNEWPGLGSALPDWLHFYTLKLMKDAGANFLRWGHCAGAPAAIRASDALGIIVVQPGVDGEFDTVRAAWQIRADAFKAAVIYFRNNPSILVWEGGNQKVSHEHAAELRSIVDKYDPWGGRVYAHRRPDEATGKFTQVCIGTEGSHELPHLPVVEGEYNREESPRRIWDDFSPPFFGYKEAIGQIYQLTAEQFAINQVEQYLRKIAKAPHCGGANWIFSDSTSGGRVTVEVARTSGEVDAARLPKQAYYACAVLYSSAPKVHIIGHWNYPVGTKKSVYVASNCQKVELILNGKSLGFGRLLNPYLTEFPEIEWAPGQLRAVGYKHGKVVATHELVSAAEPIALRLTTITAPDGFKADGADVALIDVEAVDKYGHRCPTVHTQVEFRCEGPIAWCGGYNSGKTNTIHKLQLDLECGITRVAVKSTRTPGSAKVVASAPGLKPAEIILQPRPVFENDGWTTNFPALPQPVLETVSKIGKNITSPMPPLTALCATNNRFPAGNYVNSFSYSGISPLVHLEKDLALEKKAYCDADYIFLELPDYLKGADWIQTALADAAYKALDLIELDVSTDATVYVARDDRVPPPTWLNGKFTPLTDTVPINGRKLQLYYARLKAGQSITMGSNSDLAINGEALMYIVFVKGGPPGPHK